VKEDFYMFHKIIVCVFSLALVVTALGQTKSDTSGGTKNSHGVKQKKERKMVAVIVTTLGTIEAELYEKDAPKTTANFAGLAKEGYYNGIIFHRVVPGFVIQGGDSTGTGRGGRSVYGGEFADELNPVTTSYKEGYKKGVLAMANRGPNTNTSQFFILLADQLGMPKNYTIFGKVIKGMDVVDKIGQVELVPPGARDGKPKVPVVMNKVSVKTE
jgi:cyclophilin family peptidyl-prolyl cis-trans isomerase